MDEADLFSPGKAPKMSKTARKDSRARPPPILIEGSSPPPVPSLVVHESKNDAEAEVADDGAVPRGLGLERSSTPTNDETTPGSPWRPLDLHQSPVMSPTRRQQSTGSRPPSWHRASLEVPSLWIPPALPTSPERGANRFEHHARNLSIYYPQPDGPRAPPSPTLEVPGDSLIPAGDRKAYGGPADWQFGSPRPEGTADDLESPDIPRGKRRGHHHKHSLSHNFFSFLDPTQTNPTLLSLESPINAMVTPATPKPVPMQFNAPVPSSLSPLPPSKRDPRTQLLLSFTVIEAVLGVGLWVEGQISGWRCVTALGYLVVFDAMGVGLHILSRPEKEGWRSLRNPYGSSRFTTLLCFTQSLFLAFAAMNIAKESLETVVLGPGGHDHGGGHGHGDHLTGDERPFPHLLLALASVGSLFSGAVLGNHRRLVEATSTLFLPSWYLSAPFVTEHAFLANPFTLSVALTSAVLLIAGLVVPTASLKGLDSAMSLLLTILTAALSWPPTSTFAHILLQTAPPAASVQMKALRGALRDVAGDRRVLGLGTFRCWAIDAGKPVTSTTGPPSQPSSNNVSLSIASPSASAFMRSASSTNIPNTLGLSLSTTKTEVETAQVPLVVTLVVHVHPDTTDREVLDITRTSWTKLNSAVNGRTSNEGEVSVQVTRGWEGVNAD